MALKLVDVRCKKCSHIREELIEIREDSEMDFEKCPECNAKSKEQELVIGNPQYHKHSSWGVL